MTTPLQRFLLVEPQFVLRRTVVTVARDLGVVDFHEANNVDRARTLLASEVYGGLVIDLHEYAAALALLKDLRSGALAHSADLRVIAVSAELPADDAQSLRDLSVVHVLRKPFKISSLLAAVGELSVAPA